MFDQVWQIVLTWCNLW